MVAAYICRRVFTVNASWQEMQNFCITLEQLRFSLQEFPGLRKIPAQFPRIAGQLSEYTSTQLKAFRAGERANDPNRTMRAVAERLSDREIAALAEYISGLR